ncbi:ABC transporter permease subunit [Bosea sp. (in: a-proteobacteria)]|uniref:ABC transporter permease subunit n=1 Tax=Bosea sp. (in: a-proteobacteria) TaxID=1871050 RepID=UPI002FC9DAE7
MRRSGGPATRYAVRFLIDAIRSTPILAQLYFLYFVLPFYGVTLPAMHMSSSQGGWVTCRVRHPNVVQL